MAQPAYSLPMASGALPVVDAESVLQRLPAEVRAQLAWAKRPIEVALHRLCDEPLTDALLHEVAREVTRPMIALGRAFWQAVLVDREQWRASLMEDLKREESKLRKFIADADSIDTLDRVLGVVRHAIDFALVQVPQVPGLAAVEDDVAADIVNAPEVNPMVAAQTALWGVMEAAKLGASAERARDLTDMAYLELVKVRAAFRQAGFWFVAFPHETLEDRRNRVIADAERLRRTLTEADWKSLAEARLRNLR